MQEFKIKEATRVDLPELMMLYVHLHDSPLTSIDKYIESVWSRIEKNENHHVLVGFSDEKMVSSCNIIVIENIAGHHHQRPYALIENVITHPDFRKRGYASLILSAAKDIAIKSNCYKIMLMTGSKHESTLNFYRRAGYNSNDKTAFIQWLAATDPPLNGLHFWRK